MESLSLDLTTGAVIFQTSESLQRFAPTGVKVLGEMSKEPPPPPYTEHYIPPPSFNSSAPPPPPPGWGQPQAHQHHYPSYAFPAPPNYGSTGNNVIIAEPVLFPATQVIIVGGCPVCRVREIDLLCTSSN